MDKYYLLLIFYAAKLLLQITIVVLSDVHDESATEAIKFIAKFAALCSAIALGHVFIHRFSSKPFFRQYFIFYVVARQALRSKPSKFVLIILIVFLPTVFVSGHLKYKKYCSTCVDFINRHPGGSRVPRPLLYLASSKHSIRCRAGNIQRKKFSCCFIQR